MLTPTPTLSRRGLILSGAAAAFLAATPAAAIGKLSHKRKINIAGRQRMLTQRMAKAALMVKLGVDPDKHVAMMRDAHDLFETSLVSLRDGSAEQGLPRERVAAVVDALAEVEKVWAPYGAAVKAALATRSVTDKQLTTIAALNSSALKTSNDVVQRMVFHYRDDAVPVGIAISIDVSGRQRMLSQKMGKEAGLIALGMDVEDNQAKLAGTTSLFNTSLKALMEGLPTVRLPTPPAHVQAKLKEVRGMWSDYQPTIDEIAATGAADEPKLLTVAKRSDELLALSDQAVKLYESL